MKFYLVRICFGLVDIVEDEVVRLFKYQDHKVVGVAGTMEASRQMAFRHSFMVRHEISVPRNLDKKEVDYALQNFVEEGVDRSRAFEMLLPSMSEEARQRYVF